MNDKLQEGVTIPIASNNNHLTNWAGNLVYSTPDVHYPASVEAVQELVQKSKKIRTLGSRHSFNTIADSKERLVSLEKLNRIVTLDRKQHTVTLEAGTRYGDIAPYLHEQGYALPNLASLPHITIAGACATATHGSGIENESLASSVSAIEFVDARGEVKKLSRKADGDLFNGAVVHLGALGVVTRLTLDLVPAFDVEQEVYLELPMAALEDHFNAIQSRGYSVSLFTDWQNKNITELWIKSRVKDGYTQQPVQNLYGAMPATTNVHPIANESAENVTDQLGVPGPWYDRLPHFKMGFKPSAGKELQSEYFVPIEVAYKAITALEKLQPKITPYLFISEIRTVAADNFWLSPFYQRPSVAFHFTWQQNSKAVMDLLPLIEQVLAPFHPRPHWGKLFTMPPTVIQWEYKKLTEFKQLVQTFDPTGKFRNEYLDNYILS